MITNSLSLDLIQNELYQPAFLESAMKKESNVVVSKEVAKKLRTDKNTAFVPISATDLIWEEALKQPKKSRKKK